MADSKESALKQKHLKSYTKSCQPRRNTSEVEKNISRICFKTLPEITD